MSKHFGLYQENQIPLFPAFIRPKPDELFSSWLVRLSHAHYMKVHSFTRFNFPGYHFWNRDIDRSVTDDLIEKLTIKTNTSFKELFNTTLKCYDGTLLPSHNPNGVTKWIMPLGIYHRTWLQFGLVYCPGCLEKDGDTPYFRKHWRLSLACVCEKCGLELVDRCPICSSPISFFRADLGRKSEEVGQSLNRCHSCSKSLIKGAKIKASRKLVVMQQKINTILKDGWNENVIYPFMYFEVLHHLIQLISGHKPHALSIQNFLYKKLHIKICNYSSGFKYRYEVMPMEERMNRLYAASWLLESWPDRFIKTFRKLGFYSFYLLKDFNNPPFWYWDIVMKYFYKNNVNRRFLT